MRSRALALVAGALLAVPLGACGPSHGSSRLTGKALSATNAGGPGADAPSANGSTASATAATTAAAQARKGKLAPPGATVTRPVTTTPLPSGVFKGIDTLPPAGSVSAGQTMHVGIALAGRNPGGAAAAMRALSNPASPRYHQWYTAEEWD